MSDIIERVARAIGAVECHENGIAFEQILFTAIWLGKPLSTPRLTLKRPRLFRPPALDRRDGRALRRREMTRRIGCDKIDAGFFNPCIFAG